MCPCLIAGSCRQLRERLAAEREQAVETERASARQRLAAAAERYEGAAQQARLRLVAEHDRRMAEAEDAWRHERKELQARRCRGGSEGSA